MYYAFEEKLRLKKFLKMFSNKMIAFDDIIDKGLFILIISCGSLFLFETWWMWNNWKLKNLTFYFSNIMTVQFWAPQWAVWMHNAQFIESLVRFSDSG